MIAAEAEAKNYCMVKVKPEPEIGVPVT